MWVYIPYTSYDYTKMQWPAPSGFHIPTKDEWVAVCEILTTTFWLPSNSTTMGTYLKMPMAGWRYRNNAIIQDLGSYGYYWSSTPYNANYAYNLYFYSSRIFPQYSYYYSYGFSVRCFKNSPVIPTSSWITLYDGSGIATGAWVFYNATEGIISVSGDGTTWYTIQDKNLWATTVFNQWDAVNDANCGYFYQWGNNYWFAHSWTVTTSSTQVDASNYWPWNYYNSSTFITVRNNWSSVRNDNLRWWVTGVKPMTELKNAYIGEYRVPWSNTIAYYPLTADTNDYSWNNRNLTNSWVTFVNNIWWATIPVWYWDGWDRAYRTWDYQLSAWYTISLYQKSTVNNNWFMFDMRSNNEYWQWVYLKNEWGYFKARQQKSYNTEEEYVRTQDSNRNHWVLTWTGSVWTVYFNWTQVKQASIANSINTTNWTVLSLWTRFSWNTDIFTWYLSEMIIENKVRTAQEVSDYYNLTKSLYEGGVALKSYEEIRAMTAANAVTELNTHPQEYYDKFNSEQYVRNYDWDYYITVGKWASTAQRWGDTQRDYRWIYYNSQSWISTSSEPIK